MTFQTGEENQALVTAEILIDIKLTRPQSVGGYEGPLSFIFLNVSTKWGQHDDL